MMDNKKYSLFDTVKSVGAAFIGVQSDKKRRQDFTHGKFSHFIIAGIIGVITFITLLIVVVYMVIPTA